VIVSNQLHNLYRWCTLRHSLPTLCYIFVFDWSYVCWDFQSNTHLCLSLFSIQNVGMGNHQCLISRWPYLVMRKREVCTIEEVRICDVYLFICLCLHCRCYWSREWKIAVEAVTVILVPFYILWIVVTCSSKYRPSTVWFALTLHARDHSLLNTVHWLSVCFTVLIKWKKNLKCH